MCQAPQATHLTCLRSGGSGLDPGQRAPLGTMCAQLCAKLGWPRKPSYAALGGSLQVSPKGTLVDLVG